MSDKKELIHQFARSLGFNLVGFTKAEPTEKDAEFFQKWLGDKFHGTMKYMENNVEKRFNPAQILPGAKTIICLAVNYYNLPNRAATNDLSNGKIAIYAHGRDYHKVFAPRLKKLTAYIKELFPDAQTKYYTDTGAILERAYAAKAGLGFIGKNTCLITKEFGSFVFLSEIITTAELEPDPPSKWKGSCGTCARCFNTCPTKAIKAPYTLDARRCISSLTIENKGQIPKKFHPLLNSYVFGCDICQLACPHNVRAIQTRIEDFKKPIAGSALDPNEILNIKTDEEFVQKFAGSPVMRAKRKGLQRNVRAIVRLKSGFEGKRQEFSLRGVTEARFSQGEPSKREKP